MMTKYASVPAAVFAGLLLTACGTADIDAHAQEPAAETQKLKAAKIADFEPVRSTIKPGAALQFTHTIQDKVSPGQNGSVQFTMRESYPGGVVRVEANGTEGLEVFGSAVTQSFDMTETGEHVWSVNYRAQGDGLYYLNIVATAEPDNRPAMMRAYSVRLEIGDITQAKLTPPQADVVTRPDGRRAVVMKARDVDE